MKDIAALPGWKDKPLFTPGPLTTSSTVKQAMLRDLGSRDYAFIELVKRVRDRLLAIGNAASPEYEAVILQGSGTYSLEAVISSFTPPGGKWLVAINGAYGHRFARIAEALNIDTVEVVFDEDTPLDPATVEETLKADGAITGVSAVHCETTTGIINPVEEIGAVSQKFGKRFFVDAMSSFGAVPIDLAAAGIDYLVSSANKCIEGVPGFSFTLARREAMLESEGWARSVCFDLLAQWQGLEKNGQFRFTPPTHAMLAYDRALEELDMEGGVEGRKQRYTSNYETLIAGMRRMGFKEYLEPAHQSHIITSFRFPGHPKFTFEEFYSRLNDKGFVIYPGKVSNADCFRIGTIGRLFPDDVRNLLNAIKDTMEEMGFTN